MDNRININQRYNKICWSPEQGPEAPYQYKLTTKKHIKIALKQLICHLCGKIRSSGEHSGCGIVFNTMFNPQAPMTNE